MKIITLMNKNVLNDTPDNNTIDNNFFPAGSTVYVKAS